MRLVFPVAILLAANTMGACAVEESGADDAQPATSAQNRVDPALVEIAGDFARFVSAAGSASELELRYLDLVVIDGAILLDATAAGNTGPLVNDSQALVATQLSAYGRG